MASTSAHTLRDTLLCTNTNGLPKAFSSALAQVLAELQSLRRAEIRRREVEAARPADTPADPFAHLQDTRYSAAMAGNEAAIVAAKDSKGDADGLESSAMGSMGGNTSAMNSTGGDATVARFSDEGFSLAEVTVPSSESGTGRGADDVGGRLGSRSAAQVKVSKSRPGDKARARPEPAGMSTPSTRTPGTAGAAPPAADPEEDEAELGAIGANEQAKRAVAQGLRLDDVDPAKRAELLRASEYLKFMSTQEHMRGGILNPITGVRPPTIKPGKWTYQLLLECAPIRVAVMHAISILTKCFRTLHEVSTSRRRIEVVLMLDNSGSMVLYSNYVAECVVLVLEVLRKMECASAVWLAGERQVLAKSFADATTHERGEFVLSQLTYNETTMLHSGLLTMLHSLFLVNGRTEPPEDTLRVCLLITDGITAELRDAAAADFAAAANRFGVQMCILQVIDPELIRSEVAAREARSIEETLRKSCGGPNFFKRIESTQASAMSAEVATLLTNSFEAVATTAARTAAARTSAGGSTMTAPICKEASLPPPAGLGDGLWPIVVKIPQVQGLASLRANAAMADMPSSWASVSPPNRSIPFATEIDQALPSAAASTAAIEHRQRLARAREQADQRRPHIVEEASQALTTTRAAASSDSHRCEAAAQAWSASELILATEVSSLQDCLRDVVLPTNRFTRRRPDVKGQIYIPGLIKAEMSDYAPGSARMWASKTAGGARNYAIAIAVDVSMSMKGHLEECAVVSLVTLLSALQALDLGQSVTVVFFGDSVTLVKRNVDELDFTTLCLLLSNLRFGMSGTGTADADAINVCLDMLIPSPPNVAKKCFVLTDGYSGSGLELTRSLMRAEQSGVDVVAIAVGADKTIVDMLYPRWIKAALPLALATGLRMLFSQTTGDDAASASLAKPAAATSPEAVLAGIQARVIAGAASTQDVHGRGGGRNPFSDLARSMTESRSAFIAGGGGPRSIVINLGFIIDTTGSMRPYLASTRAFISQLQTCLVNLLASDKYAHLKARLRIGFTTFRDRADSPDLASSPHAALQFPEYTVPQDVAAEKAALDDLLQKALVPLGGGDQPEDVFGGILRGVQWLKYVPDQINFALVISDGPAHGKGLYHDLPDDDHAAAVCETPATVVQETLKQRVTLSFLHVNRTMTQRTATALQQAMLKKLRQDAPAPTVAAPGASVADSTNKFTEFDLCPPSSATLTGTHFVFVLDESGSMTSALKLGQSKWSGLCDAFNLFLRDRKSLDQGNDLDRLTVIAFDHDKRYLAAMNAMQRCYPLSVAAALPASPHGGGTSYSVGLTEALSALNATPAGFTRYLVFMSDGQQTDGNAYDAVLKDIMKADCNTRGIMVGYGGADTPSLDAMAKIMCDAGTPDPSRAKSTRALDAASISAVFRDVAADHAAVQGMSQAIGSQISTALANRLMLDCL